MFSSLMHFDHPPRFNMIERCSFPIYPKKMYYFQITEIIKKAEEILCKKYRLKNKNKFYSCNIPKYY